MLQRLAEVRVRLDVATDAESEGLRHVEESLLCDLAQVRTELAADSGVAATENSTGAREHSDGVESTLLEQVMALSPVGLLVQGAGEDAPRANPRGRGLLGAVLRGETSLLRAGGERYSLGEWPLARALRGDTVAGEDAQVVSQDGRVTLLRLTAHPVRDSAGRVTQAVATVEEAVPPPASTEFLASLSHELRTPMTAILGWTRLLADEGLAKARRAHGLTVIARSARVQMMLVEDLLEASLLASGQRPLEVHPMTTRLAISQALESIRQLSSLRGLSFSVQVAPDCERVLFDGIRLQQVVRGLILIATKSTADDAVVSVAVTRTGERIRIEVRDTGDRLEAPLSSTAPEASPATSTAEIAHRLGGRGLRLSLLENLVTVLGGSLEGQSDGPDQGSSLAVCLPAPAANAPSLDPLIEDGDDIQTEVSA